MEEQQNSFKDTFLAAVLDQMDTNFYITDVETDEILYMNKTRKSDTFGYIRGCCRMYPTFCKSNENECRMKRANCFLCRVYSDLL